jgi:hypothetical protein
MILSPTRTPKKTIKACVPKTNFKIFKGISLLTCQMIDNMLQKIFSKRIEEFTQKYSSQGVRMKRDANFFGIESHGVLQVRGNGILLLTDTYLVFGMFRPPRDFLIPLARIEKIELVESHLTKTVFQPLMKVYFINEEGDADSVAWWVANPTEWKNILEQSIKNRYTSA